LQQILKELIELQKLDIQMAELRDLRGDLPHQVKSLERELKRAEKNVSDIEEQYNERKIRHSNLQGEIAALEEKREKYKKQLFDVTSNREYDAVTMEIEQASISISDRESTVLELFDEIESLESELETRKKAFEELQGSHKEKQAELDKKIQETEKDEAYLDDQIGKVKRKIPPRHLSAYERIKKAKNGMALVPVKRKSCSGCYKNLPPQKVLEIRKMNKLHLCEVCGRILYWDETVSEDGA